MKVNELLKDWLENYEKERVKSRTYHRYKGLIDISLKEPISSLKSKESIKLLNEVLLHS